MNTTGELMILPEDTNPDAPALVIGSSSIDMIARVEKKPKKGTSTPSEIQTTFGGTARNVAENLALLGQPVNLLSVVGGDPIGKEIINHTSEAGVNMDYVLCSDELPSGSYMAVVNQKGKLLYAQDDMRLIESLDKEVILDNEQLFWEASVVFLDANLPKKTLKRIFQICKTNDLKVCADPTSLTYAHKFEKYLEKIFMLTPNFAETELLCGELSGSSEREKAMYGAKCLVSKGVELAIVTIAEFGVCYATSETSGYIPAIRTEIVDPTGGGDAMAAAVIFALINNVELDEAIQLGVAAASITLGSRGAVNSKLSLESLYDHIRF